MEHLFDELIQKCAQEVPLSSEDIDQLCVALEFDRSRVYDSLSLYVARQFASRKITFEDADAVANFLWAESLFGLTGIAKDVFLAFDDGEHVPPKCPPGTDPVAKFTRTQIASILARAYLA